MKTSAIIHSAMAMLGLKEKMEKMILENSFSKEANKIPASMLKQFRIQTTLINERNVWSIAAQNPVPGKVILYLHGGAYCFNINRQQWRLVEQIVLKTGVEVIVPDYPLAPENTVVDTFAFMEELYSTMLDKDNFRQVYFIGDSAGGGLALAFAQHIVQQQTLQPSHIFLISAWLDVSMTNPDQLQYEKKDHILSRKGLTIAGSNYAGNIDLQDYRVSPLYGDLHFSATISIFTGTNDLLHPEAKALNLKLLSQNIPHHYFEYPDMFHDWVIVPALKESKEVINWIVEQTGE